MGTKIIQRVYDTEAEADAGAKAIRENGGQRGYSEQYVEQGPTEGVTSDGSTVWFINLKEYYG